MSYTPFLCALLFWLTTSVSSVFARFSLASVVSHVCCALSRGFSSFFSALPKFVGSVDPFFGAAHPRCSAHSLHQTQRYSAEPEKGCQTEDGDYTATTPTCSHQTGAPHSRWPRRLSQCACLLCHSDIVLSRGPFGFS
jgi:hypothetical protein